MKSWYDKKSGVILCEPDSADEWMRLIWEIGFDYDGYNDPENLKGLIDELIEYSKNARQCLIDGKIFEDKEESEKSWFAAKAERDKYA